jgi:hypothetical protein
MLHLIPLVGIILLLCSCSTLPSNTPSTPPDPAQTATPTARILADSFFFGCAYLDANGNGTLDSDDPGLADAMFLIALNGGGGFGAPTSGSGCATITIPGGLGEESWPVTARMEPPQESGYELVSPAEVVLERPESHADFLFADS